MSPEDKVGETPKLSREQVIERILEGGLFDCLNDPYDDGSEYGSLMTDCIRLWERAYLAGMERSAVICDELDRDYAFDALAEHCAKAIREAKP